MPLADIIKNPMRRLNPHRGLVIDVPTWSAAHDYHRMQQRLHGLSMHNPGVAAGLEVAAWNPPDNSVVIYPGMAVDSEGNTIIVGEPQRFPIQTQEPGTVYLVLQYTEVPQDDSDATSGDTAEATYTLEGYTVQERRELPDVPYVELARVTVATADATIKNAASLQGPGDNEIDLRHRQISGPRPLGEVKVGIVPLEADENGVPRHQAGAINVVQAINAATRYRASYVGTVSLAEEIRDCDLLLLTGQNEFTPDSAWLPFLTNFMDRGGIIYGEACGAGLGSAAEAGPFQVSFLQLSEQLGKPLALVERGHSLLAALHLFGEAPESEDGPTQILDGDGIIYSAGDYGCLWNAGRPEKAASREHIRSAVELGVNLGVYASNRVHLRYISLGG